MLESWKFYYKSNNLINPSVQIIMFEKSYLQIDTLVPTLEARGAKSNGDLIV